MMKRKLEPSNSKAKDEKVNDEKATMKKVPLKADLIIQLKDLQDNFNNLETIRDLQAKVEALEKEKCEIIKQTKKHKQKLYLNYFVLIVIIKPLKIQN